MLIIRRPTPKELDEFHKYLANQKREHTRVNIYNTYTIIFDDGENGYKIQCTKQTSIGSIIDKIKKYMQDI